MCLHCSSPLLATRISIRRLPAQSENRLVLPLLKDLHIIICKDLPFLTSLSFQPRNPNNIHLNIPGKPPGQDIRKKGCNNGRRRDGKTVFVPVICPLGLKELRSDDTSDLSDAILETECERGARRTFEGR